jgi:hypothetical protein
MGATRLFDVDVRTEPKFEFIKSVNIIEPEETYDWVWDALVEMADSGCWIWQGKHSDRKTPINPEISWRSKKFGHDIRRVTWLLVKKEKIIVGTVKNHCGHIECVNPQHFTIVY